MDFEKIALKATPIVMSISDFQRVKDILLRELKHVLRFVESLVEDAAYERFVESDIGKTIAKDVAKYDRYLKVQIKTLKEYVDTYKRPSTSLFSRSVDRTDRQKSLKYMPKFSHAELYFCKNTRQNIIDKLKIAHKNEPEENVRNALNVLIDNTNVLLSLIHFYYRKAKLIEQPSIRKDALDRSLNRMI